MSTQHPTINVTGTYKNAITELFCECLVCEHLWPARPDTLLYQGSGCPRCADRIPLGIEEAERRSPDMAKGQKWKTVNTLYLFTCEKHGPYPQTYGNHMYGGQKCPRCRESYGERTVADFLSSRGIDFERQKRFPDCRYKKTLPFDFCLPAKTLVEFHGAQHYVRGVFGEHKVTKKEFEIAQLRDRIKKNWARRNGYRLIVVPHTVKNIEQYLSKRLAQVSNEG
jgi:hypothetical protein